MTNEAKIAAILEFIADAEETLTDPAVLANYAALGAPTEAAISQAKAQIATLRNGTVNQGAPMTTIHIRRIVNRAGRRNGWTVTTNVVNHTLCGDDAGSYDVRESDVHTNMMMLATIAWCVDRPHTVCSKCITARAATNSTKGQNQ